MLGIDTLWVRTSQFNILHLTGVLPQNQCTVPCVNQYVSPPQPLPQMIKCGCSVDAPGIKSLLDNSSDVA